MFVNKCLIAVLLQYCLTVCFVSTSHAQPINLDQKIMVMKGERRVSDVLSELSGKTGIRFSFKPSELNTAKIVIIPETSQTLRNLLDRILFKTALTYRVLGQHIIFFPKPGSTPATPKPVVKRRAPTFQMRTASADIATRIKSIPSIVVPFDTSIRVSVPAGRRFARFQNAIFFPPALPAKEPRLFPWRLNGGLRADDLFYSGVELHAGANPVHAIVSWVTDYRVAGFRFGVGGSASLSDEWNVSFSASWGRVSRKFDVDTFRNSNITVKGELYRASLNLEKKLAAGFSLHFGPVFNVLHTTYYHNGNRRSLVSVPRIRTDVDEYYRPVNPLYLLGNTYEPSRVDNKKIWIGLQVAVLYRFLNR